MLSPIYWHPWIYRIVKYLLYGKEFERNYKIIAKEIKELKVLDLCCGDCYITKYIKKSRYIGWDINPKFVKYVRKRGINAFVKDISREDFPKTECILLFDNLYHFMPHHEEMIKRMIKSAQKKVIVVEPIKNLATSKNKIVSFIAKKLADPYKTNNIQYRLNKEMLLKIAHKYNAKKIINLGRDLMIVFENE